jgi:hypothetical protein
VKIRRLPDGDRSDAQASGWEGQCLFVDLPGSESAFPQGSLVEIENGAMVYLGELQQWSESTARILVEHSLDRDKLAAIQETWG